MTSSVEPIRVSIVATPDTQLAPMSGLFEALNSFELLSSIDPTVPPKPFSVEIVAPDSTAVTGASGLQLGTHRICSDVRQTDIVIVPLMMVEGRDWAPGRYPGLVAWLRDMHSAGATLCSACTGVLLLAETGLLDGLQATIHWAFARTFSDNFPDVTLRTEEVL